MLRKKKLMTLEVSDILGDHNDGPPNIFEGDNAQSPPIFRPPSPDIPASPGIFNNLRSGINKVSVRCSRCDGSFECLIVSTIDSGHCEVHDDWEEGWPEAVLVG